MDAPHLRTVVVALLTMLGGIVSPTIAVAAVPALVVTSAADTDDGTCDAHCTFREALGASVLAAGHDTIEFQIPPFDGTVKTITVDEALPQLASNDAAGVTIDGYSQPGASANTLAVGSDAVLLIELDGSNTTAARRGLFINGGSSVIRGLVINGFTGDAIEFNSAGANTVAGNFIGTNATGTAAKANAAAGVKVGLFSTGNTIGGTAPADRNLISGNFHGVTFISGATDNFVLGNYVGTNAAGTAAIPNTNSALFITGDRNTIGGTAVGARNVVSGNLGFGIDIAAADDTVVEGNFVGTDAAGTGALPNFDGMGVRDGAVDNRIGGTAPGAGNVLSGNTDDGADVKPIFLCCPSGNVFEGNFIGTDITGTLSIPNGQAGLTLEGSNTTVGGTAPNAGNLITNNGAQGVVLKVASNMIDPNVQNNQILGNSIFGNGTIGIDIEEDGVTPNDPNDPDDGPNHKQNFPRITSLTPNGAMTTVGGTIESTAATMFRVEFFVNDACDPSGHGEGQTFIEARTLPTGPFSVDIGVIVGGAEFVTATATDPDGNTSEFSACFPEVAPVPTATPTATGSPVPATATATPVPTLTPVPTPTSEVCDNCLDDDADSLVDRDDPDCPPRIDGGTVGLGDPKGRGKRAAKCGARLAKAGAKHAGTLLKRLQKCIQQIVKCIQQKPTDDACLQKAGAKCAKEIDAIAAKDEPKFRKVVAKACGDDAMSPADLRSAMGIGWSGEDAVCADFGVPSVDDADDVVSCVAVHHRCRVAQLLGAQVPRAFELLAAAGRDPATEFPCLPLGANGGEGGLDPKTAGKAVAKCDKALQKSGAKFVKSELKLAQKCADTIHKCLQTKDDVGSCLAKGIPKCGKLDPKLNGAAKGLEATLSAVVVKACSAEKLALSDLLDATGLGFGVQAAACGIIGVAPLDSAADVAACLARQQSCRVEQLLERAAPRLHELLEAGGLALPPRGPPGP